MPKTKIEEHVALSEAAFTLRSTLENLIQLYVKDASAEEEPCISVPLLVSALQGTVVQVDILGEKLVSLGQAVTKELHTLQSEIDNATVSLIEHDALVSQVRNLEECLATVKEAEGEELEALRNKVKALESAEHAVGVHAKLRRQEAQLDQKQARINFLETFLKLAKTEVKRSRERRRSPLSLERIASEKAVEKVDRTHIECLKCALEKEVPPLCLGHVAGDTKCILYKPLEKPTFPPEDEVPSEDI